MAVKRSWYCFIHTFSMKIKQTYIAIWEQEDKGRRYCMFWGFAYISKQKLLKKTSVILFSWTHVLRQQHVLVCSRKGYKVAYLKTCQKICTKRSQGDRDSWKNWSRGSDFHASVTPNAKGMRMMDCKLYVIPSATQQRACRAEQEPGSNKITPNKPQNKPKRPRNDRQCASVN